MVSLKSTSSGKKRKSSSLSARPSKSARYVDVPSSRLPWKRTAGVGYDFDGFEGGEGGMLELEEIDGVDIVYGQDGTDGSRRISFKVREDQLPASTTQEDGDEQYSDVPFDPSEAFNGDPDALNQGDEEEEWTGFSAVVDDEQPEEAAADVQVTRVEETVENVEPTYLEDSAATASTSKGKGKGTGKGKAKSTVVAPVQQADAYDTPFNDALLPGFQHIHLLPSLKRALLSMGFQKPSAIQDQALSTVLADSSYAVQSRDLIGVAETGSGKTLAYSLPILQEVMTTASKAASSRDPVEKEKRPLSGLILCPTRELALQVRQHVGDVVYKASIPPGSEDDTAAAGDQGKTKYTPRVNIITICGGMSIQKQKRLLSSSYGVDIIVATPGRLWEMLQDDPELSKQVKGIKFLVLDEADRMIENGHFAELESIVNLTRRPASKSGSTGGGKGKKGKGKGKAREQDDNARAAALESGTFEDDFSDPEDSLAAFPVREEMNTYVFSATMSKELQRNVKRKPKAGSNSNRFALTAEEQGHLGALAGLLAKLDFRDADPHLIDLTNEGGTVKQLQEVRVDCLLNEKDVYLYYFILRYPGRTLVFFSSIDAIRRLQPLLLLLELNIAVLHSGMQQRARLKALDRFKTSDNMVMLATDVAARGLDVPAVDHVVHYQLPRTADTYIHRSGRTARAGNEGLALQLCAPEEKPTQKALMTSLGRTERIKDLPVDFGLMSRLKDRVELARGIEVAAHRANKAAHDDAWLQKAADDMEIDLDADGSDSDHGRGVRKQKSKAAKGKEKDLRAQLKALLAQPLMLRGLSAKYLTSGASAKFASDMVKGTSHSSLLGLSKTRAVEDMRGSA